MTESLDKTRVRLLTYLVCLLLATLTIVTGWQQVMVASIEADLKLLPDKYVRTERYSCDIERLEQYFIRIDNKLDKLYQGKTP